jgi:anti-sigma regulatory factor (Ser/Thr protein kinase)
MTLLDEPGTGFEHEALFYRGEDDFLAGVLPFVLEGLARDETVLVALPRARLPLLREALGEDAPEVRLLEMERIGANPARIIGVWADAVTEATAAGRTLRGVGEPVWHGRRDVELVECQLHELLLNRAFDDGPAWRLLCPYDEHRLSRAVCEAALESHPIRSTSTDRGPSDRYAADGDLAAFAAPLTPPREGVLRGVFRGPRDIPATRRTVAQYARTCGLSEEQVEALALAASELATNSIWYGGGSGTVAMWLQDGAAVVEVSDAGHLTDPLTGRRSPALDQEGGRCLFLVHQLCDLVQLRSSPSGTTVRVLTWLPKGPGHALSS